MLAKSIKDNLEKLEDYEQKLRGQISDVDRDTESSKSDLAVCEEILAVLSAYVTKALLAVGPDQPVAVIKEMLKKQAQEDKQLKDVLEKAEDFLTRTRKEETTND